MTLPKMLSSSNTTFVRMNALRLLSLVIFTCAATAAEVPADHAEKMARGLEMFRKEVGPLLREH